MFQPFELERYFAQHEFSAKHLLCTSDCESMTVGELLGLEDNRSEASDSGNRSAFSQSLNGTWLGYTESRGAPALRSAISALYRGIDADSILVHSGAEEAILNLYLAALAPGDTVIVATPCYQSLSEIPQGIGARVIAWPIRRDAARWYFDVDEFERLAREQTPKMVVLNLPHNPTGALMSEDEFARAVEVCAARDTLLVVDEVYRGLELRGTPRLPAVCEVYERGISLSVLSKAWGLAGLRIGWLASRSADILERVAAMKDYNSICASAPSETLAMVALRHSDELIQNNKAICERNLSAFERFFERHGEVFEWLAPRAGSVAFPSLRSAGPCAPWPSADALAQELLRDTGALVLPGAAYGRDFAAHFRVGLGRRALPEGLAVFSAWIDARTRARA